MQQEDLMTPKEAAAVVTRSVMANSPFGGCSLRWRVWEQNILALVVSETFCLSENPSILFMDEGSYF